MWLLNGDLKRSLDMAMQATYDITLHIIHSMFVHIPIYVSTHE